MTEAEMIQGVASGDENAFRLLVESYRQQVVNTCFGIVHNLADAEDVAQEVFVEVFRSASGFRADARLSTWLYRIAVNRSLNWVRSRKRRNWLLPFEGIFSAAHEPAGTETPASGIESRQRAQLLHWAVDSLPDNQRTAFVLNKYEELSYQQVAEVMELSVAAVESLLHRARKNLQKKLYACYRKNGL